MSLNLSPEEISYIIDSYAGVLDFQSSHVVSEVEILSFRSSDDDSLLHLAAIRGDIRAVRLLMKAGMDPNIIGDLGNTALHYASERNNVEIVKILLDEGANPRIANELGDYPVSEVNRERGE